jgi:hypothetical protein
MLDADRGTAGHRKTRKTERRYAPCSPVASRNLASSSAKHPSKAEHQPDAGRCWLIWLRLILSSRQVNRVGNVELAKIVEGKLVRPVC